VARWSGLTSFQVRDIPITSLDNHQLRTHNLPQYAMESSKVRIEMNRQLAPGWPKLWTVSRIRQIREEKAKLAPAAFTQAAVALRVGVTVNALRAWELDRARPRKATAKRLARALGVQVDQLGLDEPPSDGTHDGPMVEAPT
jgi:DNA-binding transcriptional regulator YiaG